MAVLSTYPSTIDPFRAGSHSGLDFAYGAGTVRNNVTISNTVAGTVTLADDDTSYIEVDPTDGTVSDNITGFTAGKIPLYEVLTASGAITTVTDKRAFLVAQTIAGTGVLLTDAGTYYTTDNAEAALQEVGSQLAQKANSAQEAWITPTMLNSWVDLDAASYAGCQYMKDTLGFVHLKGMVKSGTIAQAIFTLPAGYRPAKTQYFVTTSNNAYGQVYVHSNGTVIPNAGNNAWVSINGITFKAEV